MTSFAGNIAASLDRARDRPVTAPADIRHAAHDRPGWPETIAFALQHIAIQSTYWILPVIVAAQFGLGPEAAAAFLGISVLASALSAPIQALNRGWIGSGYAMPFVPSPVLFPVYIGVAAAGYSLGAASAALIIAALAAMALFLAFPLVLRLVSVEIMGVVIFGIGVNFLPRVVDLLTASPATGSGDALSLAVFLFLFGGIILIAVVRSRYQPFAIIIGAAAGWLGGLMLFGPSQALVDEADWFALPGLAAADFAGVDAILLLECFIAMLCVIAHQLGNLLIIQRGQDASWRRPDLPPLRRGVAASLLGVVLGSLMGGMGAVSAAATAAVSVETRSYSRWIGWVGSALLAALACSPKFIALILMIAPPVRAALLLFIAGLLMISGIKLIAARNLDTRRTRCVGLGLAAGMATLLAPEFLLKYLPAAIVSPVVLPFICAMALHLATLPFVRRVASAEIKLDGDIAAATGIFAQRLAGNWALRRETADDLQHALQEIGEVLAARGEPGMNAKASLEDGDVRLMIQHALPALPAPSHRPAAADLDDAGKGAAFAMWLAARRAVDFARASTGQSATVTLGFRD